MQFIISYEFFFSRALSILSFRRDFQFAGECDERKVTRWDDLSIGDCEDGHVYLWNDYFRL